MRLVNVATMFREVSFGRAISGINELLANRVGQRQDEMVVAQFQVHSELPASRSGSRHFWD